MPIPIAITSYLVYQRSLNAGTISRAPKNFRIYASNDRITWTTLQTVTNASYVGNIYTSTGFTTNTTQ